MWLDIRTPTVCMMVAGDDDDGDGAEYPSDDACSALLYVRPLQVAGSLLA